MPGCNGNAVQSGNASQDRHLTQVARGLGSRPTHRMDKDYPNKDTKQGRCAAPVLCQCFALAKSKLDMRFRIARVGTRNPAPTWGVCPCLPADSLSLWPAW